MLKKILTDPKDKGKGCLCLPCYKILIHMVSLELVDLPRLQDSVQGFSLLNAIYHNIKCSTLTFNYVKSKGRRGAIFSHWLRSVPTHNQALTSKPRPSRLQSALVACLKQTGTRFTWPSRQNVIVIRYPDRSIKVVFGDDLSYIKIFQPGSPLTYQKKVETIGDVGKALETYLIHQRSYERALISNFLKKNKGGKA